ncbi:MAG: ATP-binding protein [Thermodesulfobacteriota bacterium]
MGRKGTGNIERRLQDIQENILLRMKYKKDPLSFTRDFLSYLMTHLLCSHGAVKLNLNPRKEMTLMDSFGLSAEYKVWHSRTAEARINEKILINGSAERIPDLLTHPGTSPFRSIYRKEGIRSFLAMPIQSPWENVGVLNLYHKEADFFPDGLVTPLQRLVFQFGTLVHLLWMHQEETEKKEKLQEKAEELKSLRDFYELIVENIPVGVVATDKRGFVVLMNQVLEKMSRQERVNVLGKKWYDAFGFSGDTRARLEETYWTGKTRYFPEIQLGLVDGEQIPVDMKTAVIRNVGNDIRGVVAICSDLTEKKRIEKEIEKIEKLTTIGRIATSVAHEIRNPLAGINSVLEIVKGRLAKDEEAQYLLKKTFDEIGRLNHFLENLLSFASFSRLSMESARIEEVCEDVLLFIHKSLASRGITLLRRFGEGLPAVYLDRAAIKQIVFNLLLNAAKAVQTAEEKKITLETMLVKDIGGMSPGIFWHQSGLPGVLPERGDSPYLCISVRDTGIGIRPPEVEKVFEPFYSTSDGIGLGLYISGKIADNHQGLIGVESEYGKGASFYLLLPVLT